MALFCVERYLGEDSDAQKTQNEETKFSIQEHIAQRKRIRDLEASNETDQHSRSKTEKQKNKKKRSAESLSEESVEHGTVGNDLQKGQIDISSNEVDDHETRQTLKRTKKAKRNKISGEDIAIETASVKESQEQEKSERKKKKKKEKNQEGLALEDHKMDQKIVSSPVHEMSGNIDKEAQNDSSGETVVKQQVQDKTDFTIIGGNRKKKDIKKVERTLPNWLANPNIVNADLKENLIPVNELSCLSPSLKKRLCEQNIKNFFPIQSAIIPTILEKIQQGTVCGLGGFQPPDLCISAPTGSGKTLAYVLPIVQALSNQVVRQLQALVILPTKDLANQVKQVFEVFTEGTSLKVGLASGNKTLAKEQESLVGQSYGSWSHVSILVCTPGRLVEHITSTANFTLHHLRFLIIDEADRLLDQSYQNWLSTVLRAAYNDSALEGEHQNQSLLTCGLQTLRKSPGAITAASMSRIQVPVQKLLFSATMTHSPEKLAPLKLYEPILFVASKPPDVQEGEGNAEGQVPLAPVISHYTIPSGLTDYMAVCDSGEKPLVVLHMLLQRKMTGVLCFTSSLEATHRLYLLIKLHGGIEVAEYSSNLNVQQRRGILRDFKQGKIQIIICSDAMARGLDIENVSYVISYDAPNYIKTYVHRVGRTARAGNEGTAITLLHSEEVHHFKELIQKTGREKIPKYRIKQDELQAMVDKYQDTLQRLEQAVRGEKKGYAIAKPAGRH